LRRNHDTRDPELRPLNDALSERLGGRRVKQLISEGAIEIAPIGFMRGRTLNNAFIVIDEAQNCTYGQIKMILTRLGWHSTMVVTGDPDQSDLLDDLSGLAEIARRLEAIAEIAVVRLADSDIVRHPLVGDMLSVL
jgi:phosphate starvation-inducible PhoH-like protein